MAAHFRLRRLQPTMPLSKFGYVSNAFWRTENWANLSTQDAASSLVRVCPSQGWRPLLVQFTCEGAGQFSVTNL